MKRLMNQELTNHGVFGVYDEIIEPYICKEAEPNCVRIEIYDAEELTDDPSNEWVVIIKVAPDLDVPDFHDDDWEENFLFAPGEHFYALNAQLDDYEVDREAAYRVEAVFRTLNNMVMVLSCF